MKLVVLRRNNLHSLTSGRSMFDIMLQWTICSLRQLPLHLQSWYSSPFQRQWTTHQEWGTKKTPLIIINLIWCNTRWRVSTFNPLNNSCMYNHMLWYPPWLAIDKRAKQETTTSSSLFSLTPDNFSWQQSTSEFVILNFNSLNTIRYTNDLENSLSSTLTQFQ
jgi:hypothetical protein